MYVISQLLDIISTYLCLAFVPGAVEANDLFRAADAGGFAVLAAITTKAIVGIVWAGIPTTALYLSARSFLLASLPFWYLGWQMMGVVAKNFTFLALFGRF